MAINILIGIGGTGAKIVESALYLLSAGVGPRPKVIIGLVDQDNSNGNVVRTEQLLQLLISLRSHFAAGKVNRIDWNSSDEDGGSNLFGIDLEPLFSGTAHWRPAPDNMPTLRHVMQHQDMPDDERALFNLLFRGDGAAPSDAEQTMDLAEGYRGRAHVGAAALVSAINHDQPEFLDRLIELMQASAGGEEIRIFMAGSLFGGTGAAGFPTIARMLHKLRGGDNQQRIQGDKVHIGGALMLPYFRFGPPDDASANVITSAQLLPQARVAIDFYQSLLQQEKVFDRLYVSGWERMFDLGYHKPGRGEQRNPALLPELVAALAAMDFFTLDVDKLPASAPLVAGRGDASTIGWADLPAHESLKRSLYDRLGGTLRFALWWRYRVEPSIDDRNIFGSIKAGWLKKLAGDTNWQVDTPEARKDIMKYVDSLLHWASSIRLFSEGTIGSFSLWNGERLLAVSDRRKPTDPVVLNAGRSEEESYADLDAMLYADDRNAPPVGATVVFKDLSEKVATGQSQGLGRLVAAVHRAARPFRDGN
ncbi:hypothetical protein [Sphingomonas sp. R86521]|uniref:hypothetical protein n=1 Tax=Sphingomonas sp. R86521 TaxID=3093860 RepID=UPI0036D21465